jgi:hypothetical protein
MAPETSNTDNATPVPYREGVSLQLEVVQDYCDVPFPKTVTAIITQVFDITMSPVMKVAIITKPESGPHIRAVLKVYDRRFGADLREIYGKDNPHTAADEAEFESFVRQGKIDPFLCELEEDRRKELLPPSAASFHDGTPEGIAQYEAALWLNCKEHFQSETEAYSQLQEVQGRLIPRMLAHVRLVQPSSELLRDLPEPEMARYFEIHGIVIELIDGYNLRELPTSPLAPADQDSWPAIVQAAVDGAHEINRRGVIMNDCQPRNVMIDARSQRPVFIDFGNCWFKDALVEMWKEMWGEPGEKGDQEEEDNPEVEGDQEDEEEDWDPEVEYWERVRSSDNPGAIGCIMQNRLQMIKGMKLEGIKYPDCDAIIENIKRERQADKEAKTDSAEKA